MKLGKKRPVAIIDYSAEFEADANSRLARLQAELSELRPGPKTIKRILSIRERIERVELELSVHGADPDQLPVAVLKQIALPIDIDFIERKYREGINNRESAIRAYCVWHMSGSADDVRYCRDTTCPLWPFRMGTDPFKGHDIAALHAQLDEEDKWQSNAETSISPAKKLRKLRKPRPV